MHDFGVIVKEEIEIDDTKIKLEIEEDEDHQPIHFSPTHDMEIIEERPNMITVAVHENSKSEAELEFLASLGTIEQQKKLFVTPETRLPSDHVCVICKLKCANYLSKESHQINHELNRFFCTHGCGCWCEMLEDILEHEYQQHVSSTSTPSCRICKLEFVDTDALSKHKSGHYFVRRFVCSICRCHFDSFEQLQLHRQQNNAQCGAVRYVDVPQVGQLVAVGTATAKTQPKESVPYDVQIKSEPMETEEQLTEVVVKTEPEEEPQINNVTWSSNSGTNLSGYLRSKLRLPTMKTPLKMIKRSDIIIPKSLQSTQFVPVSKVKIVAAPNPLNMEKYFNILKSNNHQLETSTSTTNDANLFKSTSSVPAPSGNSFIIKLPGNTKIIRVPSATRIVKIPAVSTLDTATPTVTSTKEEMDLVKLPSPMSRSEYFNNLEPFEMLPESRKIISELQNQIRTIEKEIPLPGSVLQPKPDPIKRINSMNRSELEEYRSGNRLPITKGSYLNVCKMRSTYPDYHFHWECFRCFTHHEDFTGFCSHLTGTHFIAKDELPKIYASVKAFKKSNVVIESPSASTADSPRRATKTKTKKSSPSSPISDDTASTSSEANSATPAKYKRTVARDHCCNECSKCFTTIAALRIHKMIHTGELPHKCNFCDKRFRTRGQVRVHQRRHTGEKPFKCKICSLDFTHRETLISHLSRHIGMKRYKCYGCDKNFVVVSGLRAHRRLRPDTCGKVPFTARAHGPRVRVIRGEVIFESHPEHNGYLRSEDPLKILSERNQIEKEAST